MANYYTDQNLSDTSSIYDIWENGEALGDSVTPSTYCGHYRRHMVLKLMSYTNAGERIFSIGGGNAFVEADLQKAGRLTKAIDLNARAVELALSKGVDAVTGDFFDLPRGFLSDQTVVYADGLVGHLFGRHHSLDAFFEKLSLLTERSRPWLVISNDPPRRRGVPFSQHETVPDFYFIGLDFMSSMLERAGYIVHERYYFPYYRPISGLRDRMICVGCLAD